MFDLKAEYEQTIFKVQLEIQEQTFKNISQEIHDNIGQVLSLAKLNLNVIPQNEATEKIGLTEELLTKAISDLRDLSKSLSAEKIADSGLAIAFAQEMVIIEKAAKNIHTQFYYNEEPVLISREQIIITFRIIQELLHNILKHAKASNIKLELLGSENATTILLEDNGIGFDMTGLDETKTGIGLKNIQQRCKLIGAHFTLDSKPGNGTFVKIIIQHSIH
ncbi:MAG: ATP-binding protein [Bacteroidota bacterium]